MTNHGQSRRPIKRMANILFASMLAVFLLAFFLGVVQIFAAGRFPPDNPQPFPPPNAPSVPITTSVGIEYDEPISPTTVNTRTFVVHAMQTGQLLATYGVHGGKIILTPTTPFRPGELVYASATTGTLSAIDGSSPLAPTVWQFHAAAPAGAAEFIQSAANLDTNNTAKLAVGDLDADGDLDVVLGNGNTPGEIWFNVPDPQTGYLGNYVLNQSLGIYNTWDVDLGDVDGDEDLDIFFTNNGQPNTIWLNMGGLQGGVTGVFTDSNQSLVGSFLTGSALGDLDGDGDLDAFSISSDGSGNQVWLNNGGLQGGLIGIFSDSGQLLGTQRGRDVALGDVDNDGDLDAVATAWNQTDRLWLNNGDATFVDSGQNLSGGFGISVVLGDVDGDGDLDIFVGTDNGIYPNELWINQGGLQGGTIGQYVPGGPLSPALRSRQVTMGDVDGDTDLDLIATGRLDAANIIWLNNGSGHFPITSTVLIADQADSFTIAAADVNNDHDLDIVLGYNFNDAPNGIWLNNSAPQIAEINIPAEIDEGQVLTMSVTVSSTDSPAEILTLAADWGDGTTMTQTFPAADNVRVFNHLYANNLPDNHPYSIQITVNDREGGQDQVSFNLVVMNVPPTLKNWAVTSPVDEGETALLNGVMFDPGQDDLVLSLNWGEGNQEVHQFPAGTTSFSLTHTYLDDNPTGTPSDPYTISMILLDQDLDLDLVQGNLIVQNQVPLADAGLDQTVQLGEPISFLGSFMDPGVEDTHLYWWDLGNGEVISGTLSFSYTYPTAGDYTVTLAVLDDDTGLAEDTLSVTVWDPTPPDFPVYLPLVMKTP